MLTMRQSVKLHRFVAASSRNESQSLTDDEVPELPSSISLIGHSVVPQSARTIREIAERRSD